MPESVRELFSEIIGRFDADAWGPQDAIMQFDVTGEEAGKWFAMIQGGTLRVLEGTTDNPDMTMTCSDVDLLAMVNGELNPVTAFMQGKVKIEGEMKLAMKLQGLLTS